MGSRKKACEQKGGKHCWHPIKGGNINKKPKGEPKGGTKVAKPNRKPSYRLLNPVTIPLIKKGTQKRGRPLLENEDGRNHPHVCDARHHYIPNIT